MFNVYWRNYPWFVQLILFISLMFAIASFMIFAGISLVYKVTGINAQDILNISEHTPANIRNVFLTVQLISQAGLFLLPPLLFAYMTHPSPRWYLGLRKPGRQSHWLLTILVMVGVMPIMMGVAGLIHQLPLPDSLTSAQDSHDTMMKGVMNMNTVPEMLFTLFVMAVIPGIGEELFFRGTLMKFAAKSERWGMVWPVLVTSIIFALAHGNNITGYVSIFIAGVVLALIYYYTGSLVLSMLAHFLNNGLQIAIFYFAKGNSEMTEALESDAIAWPYFIGGIILFIISFYLLWKNRTPLPNSWKDDFTAEELREKEAY